MDFELPELPYPRDALVPAMSPETIECHYDRIHRGYLGQLENALRGRSEADESIEQIVLGSSSQLFNLAAQVYAHGLFWPSLEPGGGGPPPTGPVADLLERDFGGYDPFRREWVRAGCERFGPGYLWLTLDEGRAEILATPNAETPLAMDLYPLLVVDLWEHAYFLDYRERRERYLEVLCERLLSWRFAEERLGAAG